MPRSRSWSRPGFSSPFGLVGAGIASGKLLPCSPFSMNSTPPGRPRPVTENYDDLHREAVGDGRALRHSVEAHSLRTSAGMPFQRLRTFRSRQAAVPKQKVEGSRPFSRSIPGPPMTVHGDLVML